MCDVTFGLLSVSAERKTSAFGRPLIIMQQLLSYGVSVAGFRYDANCPPYFLDDLELCAIKYIYSQRNLQFRTDNDLVAMTTDPASITDACRYTLCRLQPKCKSDLINF